MNKTESLTELLALHTDAGDVYQHPDVRNFYYTEGAESFFRHAGESAMWLRDTLAWHPDVLTGVLQADDVCSVVLLITEGDGLLVVSEGLACLSLCGDDSARLPLPEGVLYGCEVEGTDCPTGAWLFCLQRVHTAHGPGVLLHLRTETQEA